MACGVWFKPSITMIFALIALNLVHVSSYMPPKYSYDLKVYQWVDGTDCLKQTTPIHDLTIDTTYTPEQEKQFLLDMYHATNGNNWYNQTGWNTSSETSHCNWYGISCHRNTSYIKSIALYCNNLNGFLPNYIWKFRNLLSLCVPDNPDLHGRMEDFIFANMSKLQILHFMGTSFYGRIPEAVGNLSSVQRFLACEMKGQGLSGHLPENIGNMKEMVVLCLGGNNFDGQIPRSISNMKKLVFLGLQNAAGMMSGRIHDLFSFEVIEHLYVSGIKMQGRLPHSFPERIARLILPGNEIQGNLPTIFPVNLTFLNLANNRLTGDIPASLFFLPQIEVIDVSQNLFSSINKGETWPNNKSYAKYVSVAGNRNLIVEFENFTNIFLASMIGGSMGLIALNASFCDIKSHFPPGLQYINSLLICDLRSNQLYGSIPDIHSDSWYVSYLDISFNHFTCDLPQGIENLISLQYLDITGNPEMVEGHNAPMNVIAADFSRMTRYGENFTCPQARLTFNNGRLLLEPAFYEYKYCICDRGFYGDSGFCKKCMKGGTCIEPVVTSPSDLEPSIMELYAGYWPSPSASNVTHLVRCPVPEACNPHNNCTCQLQTWKNLTATASNHSVLSSLITTCDTSCICHHGNKDRFCSRCKEGFYKTGGLCFSCGKPKDNLGFHLFIPVFVMNILVILWAFLYFQKAPKTTFMVVAVQFLVIFVLTLLDMLPAWVFKLDVVIFVLCMTNRGKVPATSLIKIGIFYIQTLDYMVSTLDVWPKEIYAAQHYISSFWNLQFSSLSCEFPVVFSPIGMFAFVLLLPIISMQLIGFYLAIFYAYHKCKRQEDRIKTTHFKCRQLAMSCLNFTYFPIVEATASVLRPCGNDAGIRYMPKAPWIECSSPTHQILSILGWTSVILYVVGFPVILSIFMFAFYRKRAFLSAQEREDMDSWLGSVYLPYKPKYQLYFELILVVRRLFLAFTLSFLASLGSLQTVVIWLILTASAILQFRFQPYETSKSRCSFENTFEFTTLFVLSMSFMILRFAALGSPFTSTFVWSVILVNGFVLIGLVTCILYVFAVGKPCVCLGKLERTEGDHLLDYPVVEDRHVQSCEAVNNQGHYDN